METRKAKIQSSENHGGHSAVLTIDGVVVGGNGLAVMFGKIATGEIEDQTDPQLSNPLPKLDGRAERLSLPKWHRSDTVR